MIVKGHQWSLSSNLIHFLDLFAFICEDNNISLINHNLSKKIIPLKEKTI